jgi:hypothetical protein
MYIVLIFPHIRCHRSLLGKLPSRTSARQRLILDDSDSAPMGTEMVTRIGGRKLRRGIFIAVCVVSKVGQLLFRLAYSASHTFDVLFRHDR